MLNKKPLRREVIIFVLFQVFDLFLNSDVFLNFYVKTVIRYMSQVPEQCLLQSILKHRRAMRGFNVTIKHFILKYLICILKCWIYGILCSFVEQRFSYYKEVMESILDFKLMQNKVKHYGLCTRCSIACVPNHHRECIKKCFLVSLKRKHCSCNWMKHKNSQFVTKLISN